MNLLPAKVPNVALYDFANLLVPEDTPSGTAIRLIIKTNNRDLNVRDFSAYWAMADRVYGRVTEAGLRSYARTPGRQLRISEIRQGSIEVIIAEVIMHYHDAIPLAVLWLFLKNLPNAMKVLSEAAKNSADAYKSIEDAKLAKINRKRLQDEIKKDDALTNLDQTRIKQIAALLDGLQAVESANLSAPVRFAQEEVQSVEIVVGSKAG